MSTSFSTNTFIIKKENVPSSIYKAFGALSEDVPFSHTRCNNIDEMKSVYGSSRNGWASWNLSKILNQFGSKYLNFLLESHARFRQEDRKYGCFDEITFLESPKFIENAIKEFDAFFKWSLEHTEEVSDILEKCTPEEVTSIVSDTTVSDFPSLDQTIWYAEDGDSVEYLYAYLRSIQAVLKYALKHDFAVAHRQDGEFAVEYSEDEE